MTDQLDTAAVRAGIALLTADVLLTVYDGLVDVGAARPYVLVYGFTDRPDPADSNALDGLSRTLDVRYICHCAGDTREAATAVAQRVRANWLDVTPGIVGHPTAVTGLMKQETPAGPPTLDKSTGVEIFDQVVTYHYRVTT